METIISLIEKQKTGDVQATQEICRRMTPLLKKYAAKLYCMEYDDAHAGIIHCITGNPSVSEPHKNRSRMPELYKDNCT